MGYIREKNETHISGSGESPILYIQFTGARGVGAKCKNLLKYFSCDVMSLPIYTLN